MKEEDRSIFPIVHLRNLDQATSVILASCRSHKYSRRGSAIHVFRGEGEWDEFEHVASRGFFAWPEGFHVIAPEAQAEGSHNDECLRRRRLGASLCVYECCTGTTTVFMAEMDVVWHRPISSPG
jgi:hypothetical protein